MKRFNELTNEEMVKVFDANEQLREYVFERVTENDGWYISDILDRFEGGAVDYSLDVSGYYNYFTVKNNIAFLEGVAEAQEMFCTLSDEYTPIVERALMLAYRLYELEYRLSYHNYQQLSDRVDELVEDIRREIYKHIRAIYDGCYDRDYQLEYFTDVLADEYSESDCYVDDDYVLYETITTTRCYA